MKRLMKKFEDIMVAITFAEAGEYDSAQAILSEYESSGEEEKGGEGEAGNPAMEIV